MVSSPSVPSAHEQCLLIVNDSAQTYPTGLSAGKRIFLLSPANLGGIRAKQVMSDAAQFAVAQQLRTAEGATLGDVFSFVSRSVLRGKLAYARRFSSPPDPGDIRDRRRRAGDHTERRTARGGRVRNAGFAAPVRRRVDRSRERPLPAAARSQRASTAARRSVPTVKSCCSGASPLEICRSAAADLRRATAVSRGFVGRGDMSRGGLMLRCVDSGLELDYVPIAGAVRQGKRPPRLAPR